MSTMKVMVQSGLPDFASQIALEVAKAQGNLEEIGGLLGEAYDRLERIAEEAEEKGIATDAALLREAAALILEAAQIATTVHGRSA